MSLLSIEAWAEAKSLYPVGTVMDVCVTIVWDFMVFVELPGTRAAGSVTMTSWSDSPPPLREADCPRVGETLRAVVLGHRDDGHQVSLSFRPSDIERLERPAP